MDDIQKSEVYVYVMAHKWWLIALSPIAIILVVLKLMNPN